MSVSHGSTWKVVRSGISGPSEQGTASGPMMLPSSAMVNPPAETVANGMPLRANRWKCRAGTTLPITRPGTDVYCR